MLPEIGAAGQEKLLASRVLVVGAGGLGSPAAFYLAAAGVGTLGLMDGDTVALSNLQRQILHDTAGLGRLKVDSGAEKLERLNPDVTVRRLPFRFTAENAAGILAGYDLVVDATDNLAARYVIADACHAARKPYIHAGVSGFVGQMLTVIPGETACYRCLFEDPPPPEVMARPPNGPLSPLPGIFGTLQAAEAVKLLLGLGRPLTNRLLRVDALKMEFRTTPLKRNPDCPLCGK
jgi:molybdopterin/thiamine biosynthesis adenylyltransferase